MGCTSAKAKRIQTNFIDDESYQYNIIKRIVSVADQIDQLKEEYLVNASQKLNNFDIENYQIVCLNDFLLTAYKFNSCSKSKLKKLQNDISSILQEATDIYNKVNSLIQKVDDQIATSTSVSAMKVEIEIIFRDFIIFYQKISSSSGNIPEVKFDDYTGYEISKRISNIDSQSIVN